MLDGRTVKVRRMVRAKQSNGQSSVSSIIFTAEKLKSFIQREDEDDSGRFMGRTLGLNLASSLHAISRAAIAQHPKRMCEMRGKSKN